MKIGFIYSKTGAASATSGDSDVGCKARVGRENAAGGVNGRKIEVEYADDQTRPGTNTTAAQDLVQNKHVFMVYNDSALAFSRTSGRSTAAFRLLGAGYDGTYYGEPGNENIVSAFGNAAPVNGASYTSPRRSRRRRAPRRWRRSATASRTRRVRRPTPTPSTRFLRSA